jgi:hypothetical protein
VGGYTVNFTYTSGNSNYNSATGTTTLNVIKAPLTVTLNSYSRQYGAANPTCGWTIAGVVNNDVINVSCSISATTLSQAGAYTINAIVTGANIANYNVTINTGTLTITQATTPLVITVNNASRAYGTPNPAFTSSVSGALNGDTFTINYSTAATQFSPVGQYAINASVSGAATANYSNIIVIPGTLTITQSTTPVVITVNSTSRPYGQPNPAFTSSVSGALNGDTFTINYSTLATQFSPVGQYTINATVSGQTNYSNITVNPGTLTITPSTLPLIVSVNSVSRPYGQPNPNFTSSVSGAFNGDTFTINYFTSANQFTPVGAYAINATVSGAATANYSNIIVVPGTLYITQSTTPVVITVNSATRPYGTPNPAFTSSVSGALNGDTFTIVYSTPATQFSPVGQYAINASVSGAAIANYTSVQVVSGTLTITPASGLVVSCTSTSRLYGTANPVFGYSVSGLLNNDTVTVTCSTAATIASPVGSYTIAPSISGPAAANYNLTAVQGTLIITPSTLPLIITVNSVSRPYGTPNPTFTNSVSGALNGDSFTLSYSTAAVLTSPVGPYAINATITGGASLSNYANVQIVPGTLTITPSTTPLVITVNSVSRPYGTPNPTFTGSITGALNGDTFTVTYSTTATQFSPVGPYPIAATLSGASSANYNNVTVVPGTLTITPAATPLVVTCSNASRPYDTANPVFGYTDSGLLNGDTVTITCSTVATIASPVGGYAITAIVSGTAAANYNVQVNPGTLTITPSTTPLVVTVNNATRPYGAPNPTFTSTITGALNGDTFTVTYSTTATVLSPIGAYPITATLSGASAANYNNVTVVPGTLTITPATPPLVITVNNATRPYGTPNPTFTGSITGALNGDTFTVTYSTTATQFSPVGPYPITATLSGASAANYNNVTVNPGTLTITPSTAPLVITVNNASRPYGTANPTFTSTITGALNGDTFTVTYSTTATILSPIGAYPITATLSGASAANYNNVTVVPGTLTVTPATTLLVITVNNTTRPYGTPIPTFTSTITGAAPGDTFTVTYSTTATLLSDVGSYPITATVTGANIANYATVTVVPGALAITPLATVTTVITSATPITQGASVTFTASVTYGASLPVTAATVNFYNGATLLCAATLNSSGVATCTTTTLPVGTLTITATYQATLDFASSSATVTQVVNPGSFTLSAAPPNQFISGPGTTVYAVTVSSVQGFAGPVTLACSGLPADATCTFAIPTVTLTGSGEGASVSTTMAVTTTMADARLALPALPAPAGRTPSGLSPIAFAAVFPFGLVAFFGLSRRKRVHPRATRSPNFRLLLALCCTAAIVSLAGCACLSSINQVYTIPITGTTSVSGVSSQSTSVSLTVAQE